MKRNELIELGFISTSLIVPGSVEEFKLYRNHIELARAIIKSNKQSIYFSVSEDSLVNLTEQEFITYIKEL